MNMLAIDFETSKIPRHMPWHPESYPVILGVWSKNYEMVFDFTKQPANELVKILQKVIDAHDLIIAHNMKFEYDWCQMLNINLEEKQIWCTQVAEYLLLGQLGNIEGNQRPGKLTLKETAKRRGLPDKLDKVAEYWAAGYETDEVPRHILNEYCIRDCEIAYKIAEQQINNCREFNLLNLCMLHMELIRSLSDIEVNGLLTNVNEMKQYAADYQYEMEQVEQRLYSLVDSHIDNIGSNDQLSAALYGGTIKVDGYENVERVLKGGKIKRYQRKCKCEHTIEGLGFKPPEGTETKKLGFYKTDKITLSILEPENDRQREVLALLEKLSELSKQNSTYFEGMLKNVVHNDIDNRDYIFPSMNQTITSTGRGSSSRPNGQNLPREGTSPAKKPYKTRFGKMEE